MAGSHFVYVTYIRTTPEKLWQALLKPEFTRQYWFQCVQESAWTAGAQWRIMLPDGRVGDSGEVIEIVPPCRLVLSWRNEFMPEMRADGYSRMTCELEPQGDTVKLTLAHEIDKPESKFIEAISNGWPIILSSLKTLLETGSSLEQTRKWPQGL
ncbi:MAG: SRPBCC family protein [Burkholderiales bacterium]